MTFFINVKMATKVTLEEVLLPKDVRPIRYDIHLTVSEMSRKH